MRVAAVHGGHTHHRRVAWAHVARHNRVQRRDCRRRRHDRVRLPSAHAPRPALTPRARTRAQPFPCICPISSREISLSPRDISLVSLSPRDISLLTVGAGSGSHHRDANAGRGVPAHPGDDRLPRPGRGHQWACRAPPRPAAQRRRRGEAARHTALTPHAAPFLWELKATRHALRGAAGRAPGAVATVPDGSQGQTCMPKALSTAGRGVSA